MGTTVPTVNGQSYVLRESKTYEKEREEKRN